LYPATDVNGKAAKLESLLNHDSLIDDEAIVFSCPFDPTYEKPCERDGVNSVPNDPTVDDAYPNDAPVVDE
jgi:hypothetical protein